MTAVPRSGCLAMSSSGTAVKMPPRTRSPVLLAPRRFSPKNIARISASTMRAELGRLQVERTDVDPALRAHLRRALEQHEEQQREQAAVEEQRVLREHPVIDRQADEQRDQAEAERVHLRADLRPGVPLRGR